MNNHQSPRTQADCPSTKQLRDWLDGNVEMPQVVQKHVGICQRCTQSLAALSDDESLQALAALSSVQPQRVFSSEPEFEELRMALDAWGHDGVTQQIKSESRKLVRSHQSTFEPAEEPTVADAPTLDAPSLESLNQRLPAGRFVVDRLLAKGGAGAVYLAYDQLLRREIAIKVLARDSLRDRQRFQREARVLAELEHANIVRVFDFGTLSSDFDSQVDLQSGPTGLLYLVMEYVSGGTAGMLCIDQPAWSMRPSESDCDPATSPMSFRRLASLLATAADGLEAAHAQSLVHRDVKPGNLLLVADWSSIKVADFGLARLSDSSATQVTRTGDVLGTPVFMSPEQVNLHDNVSASSDIYSLGATLYQLITGVAPFQGGSAAVLRQVAESSPVSPRLINAAIPMDLETICLHAMEYEPASRYASMREFAADLRRFSQGESIQAKPISTATKAIRFLRRNQSFAAILAICGALLFLLTVGSVSAAIVFYNQNGKLEAAAYNERVAKQNAEDALKASITAADELLLAVTTETEFLPRAPGSQEVTRKLLQRARDYFRNFLEANTGNPALKYQLARAHAGLAAVAMRVGESSTLELETATSLELIESIPDQEIDPAKRAALKSDTILVLANYLIESGEAKRAIPMLEEAITTCSKVIKRSDKPPVDLSSSHATALFGLANAFTWVGKRDDAIPLLQSAKEMFTNLRTADQDNPTYLRNAAACEMTLATIALDQNQATVAKTHLNDAFVLLDQVDNDDAISLRIRELKIKVLTNLALADRRMGNNVEAKAGYESAIAESRLLIELEPEVSSHQWNLVVASLNSGGPDMELGNFEPLVERWQATVPVLDKLISAEPDNQRYRQVKAMLQSNIAIVLRDMGNLEEAISPLQAATETLQQQAKQLDYSPESYLPVALNHYELASTLIQLERWKEALQALDDSDTVVNAIFERDQSFTPARGHLLDTIHLRLQLQTKQGGVEPDVRKQLALQGLELARELTASNPDVAEYQLELPRAINDHAFTLLDALQFSEAIEAARESRKLIDGIRSQQVSVPPELPICQKNALLIEIRAIIDSEKESISPSVKTELKTLLGQAEQCGATKEEIAKFEEIINAKTEN